MSQSPCKLLLQSLTGAAVGLHWGVGPLLSLCIFTLKEIQRVGEEYLSFVPDRSFIIIQGSYCNFFNK